MFTFIVWDCETEWQEKRKKLNQCRSALTEVLQRVLYSLQVCEGLAHPLPHQSPPKMGVSVVQHPQQTTLYTTICLSLKEHTKHTTQHNHLSQISGRINIIIRKIRGEQMMEDTNSQVRRLEPSLNSM